MSHFQKLQAQVMPRTSDRKGAATKRSRNRELARRRRTPLCLEQLEVRLTPSGGVTFDSSTPVSIPLGNVKVGQTVAIQVDFSTTDNVDPNDRTEDEPVIIEGPGFNQTIYTYGTQTFPVPIAQNNEQLMAYVQGGDGDESATIQVITAWIYIGKDQDPGSSPGGADNIVLFNQNPAEGNGEADTSESTTATVTNLGDSTATFTVHQNDVDSGQVAMNGSNGDVTVTLAAGESQPIQITPTSVSGAPYDIHLMLNDQTTGATLGQAWMTVVSVTYNVDQVDPATSGNNIYNVDTPQSMLDGEAYRIPPRTNTNVDVTVTPDLSTVSGGLPPQSVGISVIGQSDTAGMVTVTGQDADYGTVTIQGGDPTPLMINQSETITFSGAVTNGVADQTQPVNAILAPPPTYNLLPGLISDPNAGQLQLSVQVGIQSNLIPSTGFSVAAIPTAMALGTITAMPYAGVTTGLYYGFSAQMIPVSDSDVIADLDQVAIAEVVSGTGINSNGVYVGPASLYGQVQKLYSVFGFAPLGTDFHAVSVLQLGQDIPATTQYYEFADIRTGAFGIPITRSAYKITQAWPISRVLATGVYQLNGTTAKSGIFLLSTSGDNILAGIGSETVNQFFTSPISGIPYLNTSVWIRQQVIGAPSATSEWRRPTRRDNSTARQCHRRRAVRFGCYRGERRRQCEHLVQRRRNGRLERLRRLQWHVGRNVDRTGGQRRGHLLRPIGHRPG